MSSIVSGQHSGFGTGSGAGSGNFDLLRRATHAVMREKEKALWKPSSPRSHTYFPATYLFHNTELVLKYYWRWLSQRSTRRKCFAQPNISLSP
ncbi:hypothetical protein OOU_Y34scaffold00207g14 [Pyricularia oryzae Y34]|uniref:Uncharacterized protein n=1 Tax=Pyricularia oryzae (strain Y34) TaxID=1143189 RepID=A0AA97P5S0_PYRO3|nr:hypothetical protein OOU_Y34scaffold00207g14 [Pyricularia oryzae Y34]